MLAHLFASLLSFQAAAAAAAAPPPPSPSAAPAVTTSVAPAPTAAPKQVEPAKPLQVLLMDLTPIDISAEKVKLLVGKLAASMGNRGLEVITGADLRTMANLEADKSAAGCDAASASCLAEIASALGARLVVSGQVGALDDNIFLQLSLFDAQAGRAVAREESRAKTLTVLADTIPDVVGRMLTPILGAPPAATPAPVVAPPPSMSPLIPVGSISLGVGVFAAVGLGIWSLQLDDTLANEEASGKDREFALNNGLLIVVGAAAGVVVAVGGGGLLLYGIFSE